MSVDAGLLVAQAEAFADAAGELTDLELLGPSRCDGWSRLEVVVHVRGGLDEMAASAAALVPGAPTHDDVSIWRHDPRGRRQADDDPVPHVMWLRRTASSYSRPRAAVQHLHDVVDRAARAAEALPEDGVVHENGAELAVPDFLSAWVVELVVHSLDLDLPDVDLPGAAATRSVLERLAGARVPTGVPAAEAILLATGRVPWLADLPRVDGLPVSLRSS